MSAESDKTLLIKYLGDSPVLRIVDHFLDNPMFDYSREEILESIQLSRRTLYKIWSNLERIGIVKTTRKIGKAKMYRLDTENEVVKKLIELDMALGKQAMEEAVKSEIKVSVQ
ncbi:MAG: winged helix-turn-helix domain-containing protein [Nitrososphaerales archaeon]